MNVRLVHPPEFALMGDLVGRAKEEARRSHCSFEELDDFDTGIAGTDVVYAKSWGALLTTTDEDEGTRPHREVRVVDHRREKDRRPRPTTRSSCTRCRPTATSR